MSSAIDRATQWLSWHEEPMKHMMRHEWSIGIYVGVSPWEFESPASVDNPVMTRHEVTDVPATFVADPFMLHVDHIWYMFFEVVNERTERGEIGLATSVDGMQWCYQQIVLAEPFHLSYPYVFAWNSDYYMIPESYQAGAVRLYRARRFPHIWTYVTTLLRGPYFVDASLVRYDDTWWLFTETNPAHHHDTLRLYYTTELLGPWREHPQSPIIKQDAHRARPAGRVIIVDDQVIRYTQDCASTYGKQVYAFTSTVLTTSRYQERACTDHPMLAGHGTGWNRDGMHHIDPYQRADGTWIACVDGFVWCDVPVKNVPKYVVSPRSSDLASPKLHMSTMPSLTNKPTPGHAGRTNDPMSQK